MAEYIEREDLLELYRMDDPVLNKNGHVPLPVIRQNIMDIPAADVASVRHGRWVSVPHKLARVCSVCNRDEPYKFADIDADVYDYCPNCGAKMDGERKEGAETD